MPKTYHSNIIDIFSIKGTVTLKAFDVLTTWRNKGHPVCQLLHMITDSTANIYCTKQHKAYTNYVKILLMMANTQWHWKLTHNPFNGMANLIDLDSSP